MKITVVGANSYIARNFIYILKTAAPNCIVKGYDIAESHKDGMEEYEKIDVFDKLSVKHIDMDCDLIYMFIGKTGSADSFKNPALFIDVNEKALLNLLDEYVVQKSAAKIIFPSTRLVYKGTPGLLKEEDEKEFKTIYAMAKYACENYLCMYARMFGVKYCTLRICLPYGTLIPDASSYGTADFMLKKATNGNNIQLYGDGSVRRTLTYIEDLCRILLAVGRAENCVNDVYNIGGESYSLDEIGRKIAEKYDVCVEYVPWPEAARLTESGDTVFDDSKLKKAVPIKYKMAFSRWLQGIERHS